MEPKKRELILRLADGDQRTFPILHQIDGFVHSEKIFEWLIAHEITGKTLFEVYANQFKCSWLSLGKWVVMRINKEKEMKAVIVGKDYLRK